MPLADRITEMAEGASGARARMLDKIRPWLDRSGIRAVGQDVLIAVYDRAGQESKGGIVLPETYLEDRLQGKIGLVLDLGPMCCEDCCPGYDAWFGGKPPRCGDWVGINTRDGMAFLLKDMTFRLVEWKYLRFMLTAPDLAM